MLINMKAFEKASKEMKSQLADIMMFTEHQYLFNMADHAIKELDEIKAYMENHKEKSIDKKLEEFDI